MPCRAGARLKRDTGADRPPRFITGLEEKMLNIKIPKQNQVLLIEAAQDTEKKGATINAISLKPSNWIVSDIKLEGHEVTRVELKTT